MKKYKFSFLLRTLNKWEIGRLKYKESYTIEHKLLNGYTLDYEISKRVIIGSFKKEEGLFRHPCGPVIYKEIEVDWRETIYNVKVEKVKTSNHYSFKVSFSVKLTPKEAHTIGTTLKEKYGDVRWKCKE